MNTRFPAGLGAVLRTTLASSLNIGGSAHTRSTVHSSTPAVIAPGASWRRLAMAATLGAVGLLCALQALALWRAPAAWLPATITIRLKAGESITLGQRELAAPQADKSHLSLHRDPQQGWTLQNLSATRQVVLLREGSEQRLGSVPLAQGQKFQIDGAVFEVLAASDRSIAFSRDGHAWRYDGAVLYHDGRQQEACPEAHLSSRLLAAWNRWTPSPLSIERPLAFGGNLHCDNRLGLANVTPGAAQIARRDGRIELSAGSPDGERASVLLRDSAGQTDLRRQEASLEGVRAIIVGHTRFQIDAHPAQLTLTPSRHIALAATPDLKLPEQIEWQWQQRDLWDIPHTSNATASGTSSRTSYASWAALALSLAAIAAAAGAARARARTVTLPPFATHRATAGASATTLWKLGTGLLASCCVLACGIAALVMQRLGLTPSAAISMLLGASALLLWLALPGRLSLLTAAGVILLAIGLLAQLELGLGAPESSWLRYYQKSAAMLAIGIGLGGIVRIWSIRHAERGARLKQLTIEWGLLLLAAVALAAMAAEVLWGDETGVFDLQPVELTKFALTALTAHCLALRLSWSDQPQSLVHQSARWLHLIAPALLFITLLGIGLVQVDDFSPLILLLVWSTVMAFAYALATRHRALACMVIAVSAAAAASIIYLRMTGTDDLIRWGFYADRFLVWLNPAEHPHTGQQLLLGARAITEGGWWGADHWLGLRSLGQSAGAALRIPAVQDDFAASFFLNRHGLVGALLLWALQAALLFGLFRTAACAHAAGASARDFRAAWAGRFRYFALCGGAAFALGHFLLSWGTNLAIFPIMGQPMSFLSAGGSHLLFFLCPLLTFGAISAQSLEEK
jgi:cell division protein FtsW